MTKLTVVTRHDGVVVATQRHTSSQSDHRTVKTVLVAGPGQKIHTIDYNIPIFRQRADIEDYHRKLGEHLKTVKGKH